MSQKIAVITGGSRGIGKVVADGLAEDGYHLCILSRSMGCDVANRELVIDKVNEIINTHGHIDVLVNNAGIYRGGTLENPADFDDMININLVGAYNVLHAIAPHMKDRQQGYIFNVASISGKIGHAGEGAYNASKFGLVGLSETLFRELAPHHVKVTAICPSYVATTMVSHVTEPPAASMIQPADILKLIRALLQLSPNAFIPELIVDCAATIK